MNEQANTDVQPADVPLGWGVHAWGSPNDQPLVLLHGFMQTGECWSTMVQNLARRYYVLAPTMVARTPGQATLAAMAEGAHGVAQQAMLHTGSRTVTLLGYSMGGRIALEFVRRYPHELNALVLESAGLGPATEEERAAFAERNQSLADQFERTPTMAEVVALWEKQPVFASQHNISSAKREAQHKDRMSVDKQQAIWALRYAGAENMPSADESRRMLQDLDAPVLYAAGTQDAKYAAVARSFEGSPVEVALLDCGHNIHLEIPDAFTDTVSDFLIRHQ